MIVKKRLPEVPSTTPLMKNSSFLIGQRLVVQRKTNKGRPLEQISSAAFSSLLSLSPQTSERALTNIANERVQEGDRATVGPPAPSLSRSTFCPQKLSHKEKFF